MLRYQLLRTFGYLGIRHPDKTVVDFYIPLGLSFVAVVLMACLRPGVNVWNAGGLVSILQGFIQALPGFYIAALAAVATFGRKSTMDVLIGDPAPQMTTISEGVRTKVGVTRRRFLCLLFAYLTAISILLTVFSAVCVSVAPVLHDLVSPGVRTALFCFVFCVYSACLFQMVTITFWGLYYLADRIHQPHPMDISED